MNGSINQTKNYLHSPTILFERPLSTIWKSDYSFRHNWHFDFMNEFYSFHQFKKLESLRKIHELLLSVWSIWLWMNFMFMHLSTKCKYSAFKSIQNVHSLAINVWLYFIVLNTHWTEQAFVVKVLWDKWL